MAVDVVGGQRLLVPGEIERLIEPRTADRRFDGEGLIGVDHDFEIAADRRPQELLTQANAILGQGQLSLAKYLLIAAGDDDPALKIDDIAGFLRHVLERVHLPRDLHFQTRTTIDTLDYSGGGLNQGSKLVIAAVGKPRRTLGTRVPAELSLPEGLRDPRVCLPGVLAIGGRPFQAAGADEVITIQRYAHLVGGCRMGADESTGVVDGDHRSFAVPNLFITDGSVLPTQGSANPALTIMALAARAADRMCSAHS